MNWATLRGLWDERNDRYSRRKSHGQPQSMTPTELAGVRAYRQTEVALLPAEQRQYAIAELNGWTPRVVA